MDSLLDGTWDCDRSFWSGCDDDSNAGVEILMTSPAFVTENGGLFYEREGNVCGLAVWEEDQEIQRINIEFPTRCMREGGGPTMAAPRLLCKRRATWEVIVSASSMYRTGLLLQLLGWAVVPEH